MSRDSPNLSKPEFDPISPLLPRIKEYGDFVDSQIQKMETDFAEFFKMFYETTNLAKSYMKEQIRTKYKLVDKKRKSIEILIDELNLKKEKYEKNVSASKAEQNESFWGKLFGGAEKPGERASSDTMDPNDPQNFDKK